MNYLTSGMMTNNKTLSSVQDGAKLSFSLLKFGHQFLNKINFRIFVSKVAFKLFDFNCGQNWGGGFSTH